jgi:hypothetical protein
MHSVKIAEAQANLWKKNTDIYNETPFWQHVLTGEIVVAPPGIEHYLPPTFRVPSPPRPLPEGMSLETSSSESSEDNDAPQAVPRPLVFSGSASMVGSGSRNERRPNSKLRRSVDMDANGEENGSTTKSLDLPPLIVAEPPPTPTLTSPRQWSAVSSVVSMDGMEGAVVLHSMGGSGGKGGDGTESLASSFSYTYGPDSLRAGNPGIIGRPLFQDPAPAPPPYFELYDRVLVAKRYMQSGYYVSQESKPILESVEASDMALVRQDVRNRAVQEFDFADRKIRKVGSKCFISFCVLLFSFVTFAATLMLFLDACALESGEASYLYAPIESEA